MLTKEIKFRLGRFVLAMTLAVAAVMLQLLVRKDVARDPDSLEGDADFLPVAHAEESSCETSCGVTCGGCAGSAGSGK